MNAHTPILPNPTPDGPDAWAHALMHRQLAMLGRLAEMGLEVAGAIELQATGKADPEAPPVARGDLALAYARVARAVRMTLLLQSKLIHDLRSLEAGMAITRASERRRREEVRVHRLEQAIDRAIDAETDDEETVDRLVSESIERLEDEVLYGDILERPLHEIAAEICRDLGLDPSQGHVTQMPLARADAERDQAGAPLTAILASGDFRGWSTPPPSPSRSP